MIFKQRATLQTSVLRALTTKGECNYLSAASGLVCAYGSAYVVADDQQVLARFRDSSQLGELIELSTISLPKDPKQRKKQKPDYETLFLLPSNSGTDSKLIALGSGSSPKRNHGTLVNLDTTGGWIGSPLAFDLLPIYSELKRELGDLNIEGGFVAQHANLGQTQLVLINRAVAGKSANAAVYFPISVLHDAINGEYKMTKPLDICEFDIGELDGIGLGFTDATPLEDGGWLFSAAAEDRSDSYNDGICTGSVIGQVSPNNKLSVVKRLDKKIKVEGLAVQPKSTNSRTTKRNEILNICMVTDADDPALVSQMLIAQF
jgi:hypothetical protein